MLDPHDDEANDPHAFWKDNHESYFWMAIILTIHLIMTKAYKYREISN